MKGKALWGYRAVGVVLVLLLSTAAWGSSGQGYPALWNEICGIEDENSRRAAMPLWNRLRDVLDRAESDAKRDIARNFQWFPIRDYSTRPLYCWGFGMEPKTSGPLAEQIKKSLERHANKQRMNPGEAEGWQKEQTDAFLSALWRWQQERNQRVLRIVTGDLGIPTRRGYDKAVAILLYDAVLIRNYELSPSPPAFSLETLQRDWEQNGFRPLLDGMRLEGAKEDSEKIRYELKTALRDASSHTQSRRAEFLRNAAGRFLPRILNNRFEGELKGKNLTLTVSQ